MLSKRKNIYLLHPAGQKRKRCCGNKFNRTLKNPLVYIKKSVLNRMTNHCQEEAPYEACGLLSGIREKNQALWEMKNMETSTTFAMDVNQLAQVFKWMKHRGEEWTRIYHSHPTAPPIRPEMILLMPIILKQPILLCHYLLQSLM